MNLLSSLAMVLIGILIGHEFAKYRNHKKLSQELQVKAYIDYLHCIVEYINLKSQPLSNEHQDIDSKFMDAKCRICLCCPSDVISKLNKFEAIVFATDIVTQRSMFIPVISLMREKCLGYRSTSDSNKDIEAMLLGRLRSL